MVKYLNYNNHSLKLKEIFDRKAVWIPTRIQTESPGSHVIQIRDSFTTSVIWFNRVNNTFAVLSEYCHKTGEFVLFATPEMVDIADTDYSLVQAFKHITFAPGDESVEAYNNIIEAIKELNNGTMPVYE